jgi:hypothetical protein
MRTRTALVPLAVVLVAAPGVTAQASADWNGARVHALIERARELRQSTSVDSAFRSYRADAQGHVYFLIDRPDQPERTLVKADQVALEIFWQAPELTKQRIVGLRDEQVLPTDIRYHLDHLTVVQDDFGDRIRLGDGDEVEAVLHPVGPGSEALYDFLLADSLTIRYGESEQVRVYEVRVRPKDFTRPGFIGNVYLDRATAAIVRMNFSFTPSSYVDPYLDYIRISLDNSLWMGRYWLPYRQEVELRREIPVLDVLAGSVIRGRFTIRGYDFNVALPASTFVGPRVSSVSPAQREAFVFDRGIFDDLEGERLAPSPTLEEVDEQVRELVEDEALSGLAQLRFYFSTLSDAARYNRAEGLFVGGGLSLRPRGTILVRTRAGYSFGRDRPSASVTLSGGTGRVIPSLSGYWDRLEDMGHHPGATPLENTISAASGEKDYLDPYFARGASLTLAGARAGGAGVTVRFEEHRSARDVVSDDATSEFRAVRSVHEGVLGELEVTVPAPLPRDGEARLTGTVGRLGERSFGTVRAEVGWDLRAPEQPWSAAVSAEGGMTSARAPAQMLYLMGGRWTLPGHDYRSFVGDRYWLARGEVTLPVRPPWVGVRLIGAVGSTYLGSRALPPDWDDGDSGGVRASIGAGLSIGWDAFRVDLARGLRGGGWEALFSVAPQFRAWL